MWRRWEDVLDSLDRRDEEVVHVYSWIVVELDCEDGNNNEDIDIKEDEEYADTLVRNTSDDGARNSENDSDDDY